jgi:hypothetical protein
LILKDFTQFDEGDFMVSTYNCFIIIILKVLSLSNELKADIRKRIQIIYIKIQDCVDWFNLSFTNFSLKAFESLLPQKVKVNHYYNIILLLF